MKELIEEIRLARLRPVEIRLINCLKKIKKYQFFSAHKHYKYIIVGIVDNKILFVRYNKENKIFINFNLLGIKDDDDDEIIVNRLVLEKISRDSNIIYCSGTKVFFRRIYKQIKNAY